MNKQNGSEVFELFASVLWIAIIVGWVLNIVKLCGHTSVMEVLRVVGIAVFPIGVVLGYF